MKLCVFSDIHGNGLAFDAAYPRILAEGADVNIFLGDLCGYYFDEVEIFEKLVKIPRLIALGGNHDTMFLCAARGDAKVREFYSKKYGSSLERFLKKDCQPLVSWLNERPDSYVSAEMALACYHGGPDQPLDEYIYPDADLKKFLRLPFSNFFLGHTHHPMKRFWENKMIVNPGSLGQPRQGGWPSYAVVDLAQRSVDFKEIHYDIQALIREIDAVGDKTAYLKEVLKRGMLS